jgi:transposase
LIADRGYTGAPVRDELKRRGIKAVIPTRSTEKRQLAIDHAAYAERNRIERLINRLKQYRRIATRYEKRADTLHRLPDPRRDQSWL